MLSKQAADELKAEARRLGASRVGICAAGPVPHGEALDAWLAEGYHGEMAWMARDPARRKEPRRSMPAARCSVVVAVDHARPTADGIAAYAAGEDYHDVLGRLLDELAGYARTHLGGEWRRWVDTGPLLERELAMAAGLGFIGKSTSLIHKRAGSYFLLGELLTDLELPADVPSIPHCGTCTACLDLCPTGAFPAPYVLDASRCVSYLTIELRGAIPRELRPGVGSHLFGCDVCQEVCPWNRKAGAASPHAALRGSARSAGDGPGDAVAPALELLRLDEAAFRERFRGSAVTRARRRGMARNAAVVLGNEGRLGEVRGAMADADPLVRRHAAWAAGRILRLRRGRRGSGAVRRTLGGRAALRRPGVVTKLDAPLE